MTWQLRKLYASLYPHKKHCKYFICFWWFSLQTRTITCYKSIPLLLRNPSFMISSFTCRIFSQCPKITSYKLRGQSESQSSKMACYKIIHNFSGTPVSLLLNSRLNLHQLYIPFLTLMTHHITSESYRMKCNKLLLCIPEILIISKRWKFWWKLMCMALISNPWKYETQVTKVIAVTIKNLFFHFFQM